MKYKKLNQNDIDFIGQIVGQSNIIYQLDQLLTYSKDYTEDLSYLPELVVLPDSSIEISQIVKYCNQYNIPITSRGAGTGLSGGALPIMGGIVLSFERMNRIIHIDTENLQAIVEPGVINEELQNRVKELGLFYPPDPASKGSCTLGGNIAHSSGGPKAVKYGTTKDYVLNLEVVLATGEIIETGANVLKNSTGYNLTQLMIGSEGTLGIVTKIVFKLISLPKFDYLMLACFNNNHDACTNVSAIFNAGYTPSACELITAKALSCALEFSKKTLEVPAQSQSFLLIELDGNHPEILEQEALSIAELLYKTPGVEIYSYDSSEQKEHIWKIRRSIGEAAKYNNIYKEEDTVVPRYHLPELLNYVDEIEKQFGFNSIIYGHAGDGNLHINILKDQLSDSYWNHEIKQAIVLIFKKCLELGGTISGEHGIGLVQKEYLNQLLNVKQIELFQGIKSVFDPNFILNPGKIWN